MHARQPHTRNRLADRLVALVLIVAGLTFAGCTGGLPGPTSGTRTPAEDYTRIEIRDYEGKRLDSIADEPENSIKGPQSIETSSFRLQVDGLVKTPLSLSYGEVTAMHSEKRVIDLNCVEGWTVTYLWQGVPLADLLQKAGGADPTAKVLIFHCVDGYTSSLPLDYVIGRNILLGYKMNNVTMPPERGYPFQVLAEDRFGYKWAKWVQRIEVSSDENYHGYWEKRGYDNEGTLPFSN